MIDVNRKIMETLKPLEDEGVPVRCLKYSGDKKKYVTFFIYSEKESEFEDDDAKLFESYIQVDIWSNGNYKELAKKVVKLMKSAGFIRRASGMESYEEESQVYHKAIRFYFAEVIF